MDLIFLPDKSATALATHYDNAFNKAVELYIVSAYLTLWEPPAKLNAQCRTLCVVIGRDFGITRKKACEEVREWLPARFKHRFLAAEDIVGFHPKALFWLEADGSHHALVGSSNLTRAAFSTNHEINVYSKLSASAFAGVRNWIATLETKTAQVDEEWLAEYEEATPQVRRARPASKLSRSSLPRLPSALSSKSLLHMRRAQMEEYRLHRAGLERLFKRCAHGRISNASFYDELPEHWGYEVNNRLQGRGWERLGKNSDFRELCGSFVRILEARDFDRDDVVVEEIDRLAQLGVPVRGAFLSEMLCLRYPDLYPVLNDPTTKFKIANGFKPPRSGTEGSKYLAFAKYLRRAIAANPGYPAKDLAELDTLIWRAFSTKSK